MKYNNNNGEKKRDLFSSSSHTVVESPMNTFAFVCVVVMQNTLFQLIYVLSTVHINPVLFYLNLFFFFSSVVCFFFSISVSLWIGWVCLHFFMSFGFEYANVPIELSLYNWSALSFEFSSQRFVQPDGGVGQNSLSNPSFFFIFVHIIIISIIIDSLLL